MNLSIEERLALSIVKAALYNTYDNEIDLSRFDFDTNKLIDALDRCGCAGMAAEMLSNNSSKRLINAPNALKDFVFREQNRYKIYNDFAEQTLELIGRICYENGVKCVFAGEYITAKEYLVYGSILCNHITVFVDRDIDFGYLPKEVTVKKIIENCDFFERHYNECIKFNRVNIKMLYETAENDMRGNFTLCSGLVNLYVLYSFLTEQVNHFGVFCNPQYKNELNETFGREVLVI